MARTDHDPLAGRTDRPDYVPDADIRNPTPADRRRDGAFGGVLVFLIPVLILGAGFLMWSTYLGDEGDAGVTIDVIPHETPDVVDN